MAVQSHLRSLILEPVKSMYATSYWWSIATLVLSCVFLVRRLMRKNCKNYSQKVCIENLFYTCIIYVHISHIELLLLLLISISIISCYYNYWLLQRLTDIKHRSLFVVARKWCRFFCPRLFYYVNAEKLVGWNMWFASITTAATIMINLCTVTEMCITVIFFLFFTRVRQHKSW